MLTGLFADKPVYRKFLILVFVILLSSVVMTIVGSFLAEYLYGINIFSDPESLSDLENPSVMNALKIIQIFSTGLGIILIPSIVSAILFSHEPASFLHANRSSKPVIFFLAILIMFFAIPLINMMLVFNQRLDLPDFLSQIENWIKQSEASAEKITEAFMKMDNTGELIYNIIIVALIPAVGEELLFRGVIQRLFNGITSNIHASIILTAVLFSAFHMQFYGFLPRMMLGILLGYLLVWSGSIWVPIVAHFANNALALVMAYYTSKYQMPVDPDTVGTREGDMIMILISAAMVTVTGYMIYKLSVVKRAGSA